MDPNDVRTHAGARRPAAAHRRRGRGAQVARDVASRSTRTIRRTFNLLTCWTRSTSSTRRATATSHHQARSEGSAGDARVRRAAGAAGARAVREEVSVHAEGPDSHRDVPEARRLRRAHRRAAGHDRRARRVLRPRGDTRFAEGAAARRLQLGADALARAGARDHAAAVEAARAALAHRRHLDLRGEARVARRGAAKGSSRSPPRTGVAST